MIQLIMNQIYTYINRHPWISLEMVIISLFGFQLLNIIYGFDMYDTGFHLIAYQNIFDAPDSISYNFMYYLSNILGGAFLKLYPEMGIIEFRVVGALFVLATIFFIFVTLKDEIPVIHLLLGSILVIVGYVRLPYIFKDGILSCCLYAVAIITLYKGIVCKHNILIVLGGLFVGVNIFTRLPNVLGIGVVFVILLYQKYYLCQSKLNWKDAAFFVLGIIIGIMAIFIMMTMFGHLGIFKRSIAAVFSLAGGNGTHSLLWMMKIHFASYLTTIIPLLVFYALAQIEIVVNKKKSFLLKSSFYIVMALSVSLYIYETSYVYNIIFGFFALGCIVCIIKQRNNIGLFAGLALYMLIVEIYGSDWSVNHGSLPISIERFTRMIILYYLYLPLCSLYESINHIYPDI